jgi:tetratricopeptide (TPR) repeat protein
MTAADLHRHGMLSRRRGQYAEAERDLLRAIELEHDFAAAHFDLALIYRDTGQLEDAADYLQLAVHFAPDLAAGWFELGGVLARLERVDAACTAYREALARDARHADAWLSLGSLLKAADDLNAAIDCYRRAVACEPASADAHCRLGHALYKAGRYAQARVSFEAALALRPDMVEAQHNLGLLLLETGHAAEALQRFERALAIDPDIIETRACIAHALRDLGRMGEALAQYDAVLARNPAFTDAIINRSYALLMQEDYAAGWAAYERRFTSGAMELRDFPHASWQGERLAGKRILVYAEQGLGDEIMFASCLPDLLRTGAHCVIECNTRLAAIFRRSFPQAHVHGAAKNDKKDWVRKLPPIDCQIAIGSLPRYFRRARTDFPAQGGYLAAAAQRSGYWRNELAAGSALSVGIAWRGGTPRSRQFTRSTALPQWLPLLRCQGAKFYALQYGDIAHELAELSMQGGVTITQLGDAVHDLDELAAIISSLDLVVSVDNTVAHLAGALGKTVWTLLPESPEWRYPRRGAAMPWYPSMRLFRRGIGEGWEPVIDRVTMELADIAKSKSP